MRNLEKAWGEGVRVLDRPGLILDVFALHARSREARTQVELAQLQYLLPRLAGGYGHLSRLGGGIGGRGAGEQKLELDRRKIRDRIARLRARPRRRSRSRGSCAAAGGAATARSRSRATPTPARRRSSTGSTRDSAYAADRLFATLDARAARAAVPKLREVIFVDTVGFVRKLPTSLVASFRSTLVRDPGRGPRAPRRRRVLGPRADEEERVAAETFEELGVPPERILAVWNKVDLRAIRGRSGGRRASRR